MMSTQHGNLGVAEAFLRTRLTLKTKTQKLWSSYSACDEVMSIRQTVQVESLGLTEGEVRNWSNYLQHLLQDDETNEREINATREILTRAVLAITAVVAMRNHWRFTSPASAFSAFWLESFTAVNRFDPSMGRMRFAAFMEDTLSRRAEAVADDAEGSEGKLNERQGAMLSWLEVLELDENTDPKVVFEGIQAAVKQEGMPTYFTTFKRVQNALEVMNVRGTTPNLLSIDFGGDEGTLSDTLAEDGEAAERQRLLSAISPVLAELEDAGLDQDVLALPEGALHELLEAAASGDAWIAPMALVLGMDVKFAQKVVKIIMPFYKTA